MNATVGQLVNPQAQLALPQAPVANLGQHGTTEATVQAPQLTPEILKLLQQQAAQLAQPGAVVANPNGSPVVLEAKPVQQPVAATTTLTNETEEATIERLRKIAQGDVQAAKEAGAQKPVKITVSGQDTFDILGPIITTAESLFKPVAAKVKSFFDLILGTNKSQGIAQQAFEAGVIGGVNKLHANQDALNQGLIDLADTGSEALKAFSQAVKDKKFNIPEKLAETLIALIRKFPELMKAIEVALNDLPKVSLDMDAILERVKADLADNPRLLNIVKAFEQQRGNRKMDELFNSTDMLGPDEFAKKPN